MACAAARMIPAVELLVARSDALTVKRYYPKTPFFAPT